MNLMSAIDAMVAAGCTVEQVQAVVRVHSETEEAKATDRRAKAAERKRRQRSRDVTVTERDDAGQCVTARDVLSPKKETPHTPKEKLPLSSLVRSDAGARKAAFEVFWQRWPNKVAKPEAESAHGKVWTENEAILAGIVRYVAGKPVDRNWMHPATFLNGRRWEDQPVLPPARAGPRVNHHAKPSSLGKLHEISRGKSTDSGFELDEQASWPAGEIIDGTFVEEPVGDGFHRGEA